MNKKENIQLNFNIYLKKIVKYMPVDGPVSLQL